MVLLAVVTAVCVGSLLAPARAYWTQRQQLADQRADIAVRLDSVAHLHRQVARWQDPAYVAAQARSRLRYIKPGESSYVVLTSPPPRAVPSRSSAAAEPSASATSR